MTEVLVHRRLRKCPFGTQEPDLQRLFLREAGRHDLAEQTHDLFVAQRALRPRRRIALEHETQHFGLALRPVEIDQFACAAFGYADGARKPRPLVEQRMQLAVDVVDATADPGDVLLRRGAFAGGGLALALALGGHATSVRGV
jgi:hypothetical protein